MKIIDTTNTTPPNTETVKVLHVMASHVPEDILWDGDLQLFIFDKYIFSSKYLESAFLSSKTWEQMLSDYEEEMVEQMREGFIDTTV